MLTLRTLPLRNARYHWRGNLPVLLGVVVGAAALIGALVVGDSLRGSLRERALRQLNGIESSYQGTRMVRAALADHLPGDVTAAMMLQGSVRHEPTAGDPRQIARATIVGLSDRGREAFGLPAVTGWDRGAAVAVVSHRVADRLAAADGQTIALGVEKMSSVPRSSLLGRRSLDEVGTLLRANVAAVLPAAHPANDFSTSPGPTPPLLVYVPLGFLQARLDVPGQANALFARSGSAAEISTALAAHLNLEDWGVRVQVAPKRRAYVSVESDQLTLSPVVASATEAAAREVGAASARTFSYLANAITAGMEPVLGKDLGTGQKLIPYSIVTALDPTAPAPLGPFLPPGVPSLANDEIVLVDWPQSPLRGLTPGTPVTLSYFKPEMEAKVEEGVARFTFRGFVPFTGPADDPDLTPPFPGITDRTDIGSWDPPFEMANRIHSGDVHEQYWDAHRATPKAYITLATGEKLFASRFGVATSVRVAPAPSRTVEQTADVIRTAMLRHLDPDAAGLRFEPTRERVLKASRGGTDFGLLFLMFSGLLIGAALLLVGLLFRLAVERRAKEVGVLLASGYSPRQVRNLLLVEGATVAAVGTLIGLMAALGYAQIMLTVLTELWPDANVGSYLRLHVTPVSLAAGFAATMIVAVVTIWLGVRGLVRVSPPALLRGTTVTAIDAIAPPPKFTGAITVAMGCALIGAELLYFGTTRSNPDERAGSFFGGGGLMLAGGLVLTRALFRRRLDAVIRGRGIVGVAALGRRSIARNAGRSLLTAALIAAASFLVVSVESFRRRTDDDFLRVDGGSGGFRLVAEAVVPVFEPFDQDPGREDLLDRLAGEVFQPAEQKNPTGPTRRQMRADAAAILSEVKAFAFRLQGGDDASCMNLYQAGQPRILGVPDDLIDRGGFRFAETTATTSSQRANPWLLLREPPRDDAIPVFAEQNTAMFMLKTMVGDTTTIRDGNGVPVKVRIVGTLQDSVFQSELLMSDANFRVLFPRQEGFRVFLLDVPVAHEAEVSRLLEAGLRANGLTVDRSTDRVAAYQAVVGAYLSTFQLLGGFALLLAVLGLGVVILRSVWERESELALLRAVGYTTAALQVMIVTETTLVLLAGVTVGVVSAVASVAPNLALGGSVPWVKIGALLLAVAATGTVVAVVATAGIARAPLIPALRKD